MSTRRPTKLSHASRRNEPKARPRPRPVPTFSLRPVDNEGWEERLAETLDRLRRAEGGPA